MKKIYIFKGLEIVSVNYHSGWWLVIICDNENKLFEMLETQKNKEFLFDYDREEIETRLKEWKVKIFDIDTDKDDLIYFPDAWCC